MSVAADRAGVGIDIEGRERALVRQPDDAKPSAVVVRREEQDGIHLRTVEHGAVERHDDDRSKPTKQQIADRFAIVRMEQLRWEDEREPPIGCRNPTECTTK